MNLKTVIVASVLVIAGAGMFTGALMTADFNFKSFSFTEYETHTYSITESFESITVNAATADVTVKSSPDGSCSVEFYENTKVSHTAKAENGTLTLMTDDNTKWYDRIGINIGTPTITLYLPDGSYSSLSVDITTGDTLIGGGFTFGSVSADSTTGEIYVDGVSAGTLTLSVTTGDIALNGVKSDNVSINTGTGDVAVTELVCGTLTTDGSSGDLSIGNTSVSGLFDANRTTGDIMLEDFDAGIIKVSTTTGDITGTLLTEKSFDVRTSTGDIEVPVISSGSENILTSTTGDISIRTVK